MKRLLDKVVGNATKMDCPMMSEALHELETSICPNPTMHLFDLTKDLTFPRRPHWHSRMFECEKNEWCIVEIPHSCFKYWKNLFFNSSWQALPWDVTTICCLLEMQTQSDSLSTFNAAEWSPLYHCTRTSSDRPLFLDLHPRPDKESCHIRGRIDDLSFPFIFHKGWWNGNERNSQGAGCKGSQWG